MESKIEELIAEVICSSDRWYFNLKETLPLAQTVVKALEKQGYEIVQRHRSTITFMTGKGGIK